MSRGSGALISIERLKQRGPQPLSEKSGALGIQMGAINEDVLWQFGMLKGQYYKQAFFGSGNLELAGRVVHIAGGRNQKEEARPILPAQFIQQTKARQGFRQDFFIWR